MRELENKVCYNDIKEINQYQLNNSKSNLFDKSNFESMLFEDQKSINISSIENDNKNLKKQIIERKNILKNFRHSCSMNKSSPCKGNSKREIVNILSKKDMNDHPKLLIDFNQGEILKNKHKILYNEYRSIIKSKQFLSEIEENDELNENNYFKENDEISQNKNEKDEFDDFKNKENSEFRSKISEYLREIDNKNQLIKDLEGKLTIFSEEIKKNERI
jgi:flagellar motility protein MotE (MotC chaperone)